MNASLPVALGLCFLTALVSADVTTQTDTASGLRQWNLKQAGLQLNLSQRYPDQTRAFFLARGFPRAIADQLGRGCVFKSVARDVGTAAEQPVSVALKDWVMRIDGVEQPVRLKGDWLAFWNTGQGDDPEPEARLSQAARLAFRWATLPDQQTFAQSGDYNWGMIAFGPPPETRFDLRVVWRSGGQRHEQWIKEIECPADI